MPLSTKLSLWDIAVEENRHLRQLEKEGRIDELNKTITQGRIGTETLMVVIGSKSGGKTTIINQFLDKNENPRPTLALEYTYGRRLNKNLLVKEVCHIWELGGGIHHTTLLTTPIRSKNLLVTSVIVVIDLSQPHAVWSTVEALVNSVRSTVQIALSSVRDKRERETLEKELKQKAWSRVGADHPDSARMDPILLPVGFIGSKYDVFQNFDAGQKKLVCQVLRYFSHVCGAALQFCSNNDPGIVKKTREMISHFAFRTSPSKGLSQDYNTQLIIPSGADSLESIMGSSSVNELKRHFKEMFAQSESEMQPVTLPDDPAKDPAFKENDIDALRAQKDEELERYRRDMEHRKRLAEEMELA